MSIPRIRVLPDADAVASAGVELVVEAFRASSAVRDTFSVALAGGHTPRLMYQRLAQSLSIDWSRVQLYFGDERCVPPDSPDSNFRMACENLIEPASIPYDHVHRMRGEIDPAAAAAEYDQILETAFAGGGLDVVILGMGEDGHTASLFPGTKALHETQRLCVANFVPNLNTWRLTLSPVFLNRSARVLFLVTGQAKAAAVQQALEGQADPDRLPVRLIDPVSGSLIWLLDAAAAGMSQ